MKENRGQKAQKVLLVHGGILGLKGRKDHQEIKERKEKEDRPLQRFRELRFLSAGVKSCLETTPCRNH